MAENQEGQQIEKNPPKHETKYPRGLSLALIMLGVYLAIFLTSLVRLLSTL